MNFFRSITAAAASIALSALPTLAAVDSGTKSLLNTINSNGIQVNVNSDECDTDYLGKYVFSGMKRSLVLCPGETVDPIDFATVRHEAWHAIQHCVNAARGTDLNTPVQADLHKLTEWIDEGLTRETVDYVRQEYPEDQWWIEWEANLVEIHMSASQIEEIFEGACLAD